MWDIPGLIKAGMELAKESVRVIFPTAEEKEKDFSLRARNAFRAFLKRSNEATRKRNEDPSKK